MAVLVFSSPGAPAAGAAASVCGCFGIWGWGCAGATAGGVAVAVVSATYGTGSDGPVVTGSAAVDILRSSLETVGSCGLTTFAAKYPPPSPAATATTTVPTPAK
ncbi:hypothetical protein ACFIOY_02130 [Bradyrhizobium sp. TZ2]